MARQLAREQQNDGESLPRLEKHHQTEWIITVCNNGCRWKLLRITQSNGSIVCTTRGEARADVENQHNVNTG